MIVRIRTQVVMSLTDVCPPESLVRASTPPANAMAMVCATDTDAAEPAATHTGVLAILLKQLYPWIRAR